MATTTTSRPATRRQGALTTRAVSALIGSMVWVPAVAGCADSVPTERPTNQQSLEDWDSGQPAVGADIRAKAQRLYESFAGTPQQQNALSVLRAYEGNQGMDQCMERAGYPEWDWSLSRTYADPADPLTSSTWLAMPMPRWRSHDLVAGKPFLAAEVVMNADDVTPEYSAAGGLPLDNPGGRIHIGESSDRRYRLL